MSENKTMPKSKFLSVIWTEICVVPTTFRMSEHGFSCIQNLNGKLVSERPLEIPMLYKLNGTELCTVDVRNPNIPFGKPNKIYFGFQTFGFQTFGLFGLFDCSVLL